MYGILPKDARQNIELGKLPTERMSQKKILAAEKVDRIACFGAGTSCRWQRQ